ncbi:MAG: nickel-responsive transcriptional regulator NikR [Sneathiella sp.]
MERITITIEDELLAEFDEYMENKGYSNRSEGIRDALRHMLSHESEADDDLEKCVGCVSYVYNHKERLLSSKLVETQHHHHEIPAATLHLHVDADNCMEATILSGTAKQVKEMANDIITETGVRYGKLHLIPIK